MQRKQAARSARGQVVLDGRTIESDGLMIVDDTAGYHAHGLLLVLRSDYRQPFGRYDGSLPGIGRVIGGLGVMEHHISRW